MTTTYAERFPAISSPAACPKCGSMDLSHPWCGRRTGVWLSTCRDCHTAVRSSQPFDILPRKALKYDAPKEVRISKDDWKRLASAQLVKLNAVDPKLRQVSREPGEDDVE